MSDLVTTSLGALLLGIFFNTFLYGLVTSQYITYVNTDFADPAWIKSLVFILFSLDTFHSASVIYMAWVKCVENYTNPSFLLTPVWPYPLTVSITSAIAFLVQIFLSYRIYRLTKWKICCAIIFLLSFGSLSVGMICGASVWKAESLTQVAAIRPLVTGWLSLKLGVDILITGTLSYALVQSRTGFHRSDTIINRLIRASLQTGLLIGVFSVLSLVLFLEDPGSEFFGMLVIPVGRIYTSTLMDTLLVRHNLREMVLDECQMKSVITNAIWMFDRAKVAQTPLTGPKSIQLHVRREVFTDAHLESAQPRPSSLDITPSSTPEACDRVVGGCRSYAEDKASSPTPEAFVRVVGGCRSYAEDKVFTPSSTPEAFVRVVGGCRSYAEDKTLPSFIPSRHHT